MNNIIILIFNIFTISIFYFSSTSVLAQSTPSLEKYDDRKDIGQNLPPSSSASTDAQMRNNPALINPQSPAGINQNPSTTYPSSSSTVNPSSSKADSSTDNTTGINK